LLLQLFTIYGSEKNQLKKKLTTRLSAARKVRARKAFIVGLPHNEELATN
jgi:hypothetical protein